MTDRHLLIAAPPSETTCEDCRYHMAWRGLDSSVHHSCELLCADDQGHYPLRHPSCLALETAAQERVPRIETSIMEKTPRELRIEEGKK